jgi:hypothetical protein
VITDPPPRIARLRKQFEASDAALALALPPARELQAATVALGTALGTEHQGEVKRAGDDLLRGLSDFYEVPRPTLAVLGVRPHQVIEGTLSYELFGDYAPGSQRIRVWMRTAILGKVTSHRGLLNTLVHEFCHHLDVRRLGFGDTPHTRGFYTRIDALYHLALATPREKQRPLVWIRSGDRFRVDWRALRAKGPVPRRRP